MNASTLPEQTDPSSPMANWRVSDVITEMQAAVCDAGWFCTQMDRNEQTRLCYWDGKDYTGRKNGSKAKPALPWKGAADHEVHLAQELINERNAMRLAAVVRGSLSVDPTESTDQARAIAMKTVMRYYLSTAMKTLVPVQSTRMGSWADRWGHSLLYVGWKEERAVERKTVTQQEMVEAATEQQLQEAEAQEQEVDENTVAIISERTEADFRDAVLSKANETTVAALLLRMDPGLAARGDAGEKEALRVVREMRKGKESVEYFSSFVKKSHPVWEALVPFVDVFYPAETVFEDNLDGARWIARVKWLSAQQLREQAAVMDWDAKWVEEVIKSQRGKAMSFSGNTQVPGWVMSGAGVRWMGRAPTGSVVTSGEAERNLFQIIEMWDRSTTPDGLTGTYHTVFHAEIKDKVAKRTLLDYWSGCYPFVVCTAEKDEKLLLANRGIPEIVMTPQQAVKAQWDSRTDAASLATVPPWTGPPELAGTQIKPGAFIEQWRAGTVEAFRIPAPDGRSIEIEKTLRASVDRFYGRMSESVPDALSMLMGQSEMDWFLMSFSQAVSLTAKLVQQFMPPLMGARISGTQEVFNARREDVRGSFDFNVRFDVRGLDIDWARQMLEFVQKILLPMDRNGQIKTGPLLEFGFNVLDPTLAQRAMIPADEANSQMQDKARMALAEIFSGGAPMVKEGDDYGVIAQTVVDEITRSPLRQQTLMTNPQIREVTISYLQALVANQQQYQQNPTIGRTLQEDPLPVNDAAQNLLQQLQSIPDNQAPAL